MTITYVYGNNLYVNTTNQCSCNCEFCVRITGDGVGTGNNLWLEREPTKEEILAAIEKEKLEKYQEVVFCGFGEPTFRWDDIAWVCENLKRRHDVTIRLDTNGHGNLICGRDITPELTGRVDIVSVSLNRSDEQQYLAACRPTIPNAFSAMLEFTRLATKTVKTVVMTVVDNMPKEEIDRCEQLAKSLGAGFRVRHYSTVWTA